MWVIIYIPELSLASSRLGSSGLGILSGVPLATEGGKDLLGLHFTIMEAK